MMHTRIELIINYNNQDYSSATDPTVHNHIN